MQLIETTTLMLPLAGQFTLCIAWFDDAGGQCHCYSITPQTLYTPDQLPEPCCADALQSKLRYRIVKLYC